MAAKYVVNNSEPNVYAGDIPWSEVFVRASKLLDYHDCEFLCWALGRTGISTCQQRRMQDYIMSLLGPVGGVLETWVIEVVGFDALDSIKQRDPGLIQTRKAWARALSRQFKKAGL